HLSETMVFHNEDRNPARANIKQALGRPHKGVKASDELPRLPPAREIEFGIELIPGAEPISKAPYRMASVELKDIYRRCWRMAL
ncbi:hypothetical protein Tco_0146620, partial [Tanacetum coccineum]